MNKVILLDRDGVINADSINYIRCEEDFNFLPGSKEAIARLTQLGYQLGIATNQSGVSRGYYTEQTLLSIHQKMLSELQLVGGEIAAIEYCIHMPEEGCKCRKPQPGLLLGLAKKLACSLEGVHFVGDRVSDIQAAMAAGATPVMVLSPMTDRAGLMNYPEVPVFHSLLDYVRSLDKLHD
ncbi:D,D-heptose 1,7-bisphosphate phosphatase [Legionella birminghamensis]|uniref:D,D-heptose 1,7-bisphosphate phosphatase n=1 Tax=Legionella birminghamensis TaxID=28083 RepID=A0A378IC89_9GAMM|nr:D-glycero-beta-D-manno-heptose 1,7-bisphosphate 7-phosphatase [Legionella birminghamensis]KTC71627.1 D,D-heptose 1,7-bisphosphate phosphatase [Legionella birminghamensis]STX32536.1 D,D-heptose 1,7-bisphosphate phosphatase [Legionella birminghamensis]